MLVSTVAAPAAVQPGSAMHAKRRIDVMLSSTFRDLEPHRQAVLHALVAQGLHPLAQEYDAALPDAGLIEASLAKVDAADAYVMIIGARYGQRPSCPQRNPAGQSLTALEYQRAVSRQLPRCIFIMRPDHPLSLADLEQAVGEGPEARRLHTALIAAARADRIVAEFSSVDHLGAQATTSFAALARLFEQAQAAAAVPLPAGPDAVLPTEPPAFHCVRKPYVEKQGFAGRRDELAQIDRWAAGTQTLLLFQAIGGMGKSMLTWHWVKNRAAAARPDWAGQLWYSFYEQGADLGDFCVQALAYIRRQPPAVFRQRSTLSLGAELRQDLDERPWLLVLDGLERVLVAYNRAGKEHMTDEEAQIATDGLGLDRQPRACFRAEDDDVLAMLAQAARGKLLASSRLMPLALSGPSGQPIPGVSHLALQGLRPDDAEAVLRQAGVRGDSVRMRRFLDEQFGGHPLSVAVVAGRVAGFLPARGDFDRWVEHPGGGADPALIALDLRGRQNHVLAAAFADLDEAEKALLGSIAIANIELHHELLCILNPMRPVEPPKAEAVGRSSAGDGTRRWAQDAPGSVKAVRARHRPGDPAPPAKADAPQAAIHVEWQRQAQQADAWLDRTLPGLEARGLLQYDAGTGSIDMHPAIRHVVLSRLSAQARESTGSHVSDALSSRPVKAFDEATTLAELALPMARVQALQAAGKIGAAWQLLDSSGLVLALLRLEYHHRRLELLQPFFPRGWLEGALAVSEAERDDVVEQAVFSLGNVGRAEQALQLMEQRIAARRGRGASVTSSDLGNLSVALSRAGKSSRASRLQLLAIRLAEAQGRDDDWLWLNGNRADRQLVCGRLADAQQVLDEMRPILKQPFVRPKRQAQMLRIELEVALRSGALDVAQAEAQLQRIRELGERHEERWALHAIAVWHQGRGEHPRAIQVFDELIAIGRDSDWLALPSCEVRRALSLLALGHLEEARRVAAVFVPPMDMPHAELALLHLGLGDLERARQHALKGYTESWGEGPPHHDHEDLEDCRAVLTRCGEPEPALPPFDPASVAPFDFEEDVEDLIARLLAQRRPTG